MKSLSCFQAIVMAIVLLLSSTSALAQMPQLALPLPIGETWVLTRAYNALPTHVGQDQYALDFTQPGCDAWNKPIYAAAPGIVEIQPWNPTGYGHHLYVNHGNGYKTHYGHLESFSVNDGDQVGYGTEIGRCGHSGNVEGVSCPEHPGTHLHFKVLHNGAPVQPEPLSGYFDFPDGEPQMSIYVWPIGRLPYSSEEDVVYSFLSKYHEVLLDNHPLGNPWDNGGSPYVHELNGMLIQDFLGYSNNYNLPYTAITYFHDNPWMSMEPRLLKEGFWDAYMNHKGWINLGIPVTNEYPDNGRTRQRFWRLGPNYVNNPGDWERRYLDYNPSTGEIIPLDHNAQAMTWAEATVSLNGARSGVENFPVVIEPMHRIEFNEASMSDSVGGGSGLVQTSGKILNSSFITGDELMTDARNNRTANGVYHSGMFVADFDQSFELIDQQDYRDFYAVVNEAVIPIDDFVMNGNTTIYIGNPPPAANLLFDFWTIYPNPGVVGGELHVEGEMWNAGGVSVTATEVRVELLDPNGTEVYHYSEYNVTVDPGWGWYQWLYCYPYMPGNHTARFRCQIAGQWQTLAITTIYVQPILPTVSFNRSPTLGPVPLMVQFTNQSGNYPTSWNWDFGDGQTSTVQNPNHSYNSVGTFNVSLTASNAAGSSTFTWDNCVTVNPAAPAPVASFGRYPNFGTVPLTVGFSDQSDNYPTSWNWDFGDGQTSTVQNPTHIYTSIGAFSVSLTVSNAAGTDTETWNNCVVVITAPPLPVANFTSNRTSGSPSIIILFTDLSTGNPTSRHWDFGDGETSTAQNPLHIYDSVGSYDVSLLVTNATGSDSLLRQGYITVELPPAFLQLSIARLLNGDIVLDWEAVPEAIAYNVYAQHNGGEWELLLETSSPTCSMSGVDFWPGNYWAFYVKAVM